MPDKEQVGKVDHRAEAMRVAAEVAEGYDYNINIDIALAQAHASLAIAEQLERLNETLSVANLTYADGMVRNG